jgi:hypothetical protein
VRARHISAEAREVLERVTRLPIARVPFERLGGRERQLVGDLRRLHLIEDHDLGSGLVTNVGVLALANDFAWSPTNAPHNVFRAAKYHASGTGVTAAAATDIKLQTASGFGGQTPVAGTQVLSSAANAQKYQSVATISYTGGEAVTEWGFFAYDSTLPATSALSDATGSPFTAGSGTTGTVTATPLTASSASVMGQQMSIFENTGNATPSWGLVLSNTTSVVTVPAWYKVSDGTAGANPANTNAYVIRPIMWDHKVFSAINVANGDSIQFTYTLTISSGGCSAASIGRASARSSAFASSAA